MPELRKAPSGTPLPNDYRTLADPDLPPFDPAVGDVICRRVPTGGKDLDGRLMTRVSCNLDQAIVHHSPTGFEWNYSGSGPADFALNILHRFLPPTRYELAAGDGEVPADSDAEEDLAALGAFDTERCRDGEVSREAWLLHQDFKREFIAPLPPSGGTIPGAVIRQWIQSKSGQWSVASGQPESGFLS